MLCHRPVLRLQFRHKEGSEESWPFVGAMTEISVEVVAWRWSMQSWLDFWHVKELFVVILSMGFALGYVYAKYRIESKGASYDGPERSRLPIPSAPLRCEFCTDKVNPQIFPYNRCSFCGASPSYHHGRCCPEKRTEGMKRKISWRTIATQSQCTYKRKLLTPRFLVLPELAEGVSDVSFPE